MGVTVGPFTEEGSLCSCLPHATVTSAPVWLCHTRRAAWVPRADFRVDSSPRPTDYPEQYFPGDRHGYQS